MTPSITEPAGTLHESGVHSQSSFSLSDGELDHAPQFLEEQQPKKTNVLRPGAKAGYDRSSSMREVRKQLKLSQERRKQLFNSVTQKNNVRKSTGVPEKKGPLQVSRKESTASRNSLSRVEYRHFRKHEFFEEKLKMQREKVRFMIEEDPESDRKVVFRNNSSFIKVR